jgi:nuclear receptor subfamily 2 group E member 1
VIVVVAAVQHERGPRNSTIRRQMSMLMKDGGPSSPPGSMMSSSPMTTSGGGGGALDLALPKRAPMTAAPELSGEAVCEAAARLLFMNVKWARSLPAFSSLCLKDQLLLLELSWRELFVLGAVQFGLPLEPLQQAAAALGVGQALRAFADTIDKFRIVGVDHNEFACLRAVILFKTGEYFALFISSLSCIYGFNEITFDTIFVSN